MCLNMFACFVFERFFQLYIGFLSFSITFHSESISVPLFSMHCSIIVRQVYFIFHQFSIMFHQFSIMFLQFSFIFQSFPHMLQFYLPTVLAYQTKDHATHAQMVYRGLNNHKYIYINIQSYQNLEAYGQIYVNIYINT